MLRAISKRSLFLFCCDSIAVFTAYFAALSLKSGALTITSEIPPFLYVAIFVMGFVYYVFDLYYPFKYFGKAQTVADVSLATLISMLILGSFSYFDRTLLVARTVFFMAGIILVPLTFLVRLLYDGLFKSRFLDKRVLVLGTGAFAQEVVKVIKEIPHSGMEIIGYVGEGEEKKETLKDGVPIVGGMKDLLSLVDWYNIEVVVLALDSSRGLSEARVLSEMMLRKVHVTSAIHLYERVSGEIPYNLINEHFLLSLMAQVRMRPYLKLKRMIDLLAGTVLFALLLPVLILSTLLLFVSGTHQVFFSQKRVGQDGRLFELYKLRTMKTVKGKNKQQITFIGALLRKYRIDEIPQLLNVIMGSMSLIGPRPEVPFFVKRSREKIPFYDTVLALKPGLTGWAQVNLQHVTSVKDYDKKFRLNLYYLKNLSLTLDIMILLRTVRVIVFGKGK